MSCYFGTGPRRPNHGRQFCYRQAKSAVARSPLYTLREFAAAQSVTWTELWGRASAGAKGSCAPLPARVGGKRNASGNTVSLYRLDELRAWWAAVRVQ